MENKSKRKFITFALLAVVAAIVTFVFTTSDFSFFAGKAVLSGNTPSAVSTSTLNKHANAEDRMTIVIGLQLRNADELNKLLAEQTTPGSPNYRRFLTPDQFAARFSPTHADVDQVLAFLGKNGIKVISVTPNRTLIQAEGTVSQLEAAFGVTINEYTWTSPAGVKKTFKSNAQDPSIPSNLKGIVQSVIGLNTLAEFESMLRRSPNNPAPKANVSGFTPQDMATVYNYPNDNNKNATTKLTGKGVKIAIATAENYDQKDMDEYYKQFGIKRTGQVVNIYINGNANKVNGETTLDLQMVAGQATGADILVYMGHDPKFTTFTLVFNQIVTDNKADIMTVSWGLCEAGTGAAQMATEQAIFKQGAAQGIAMFAAAGDDGAYDCPTRTPMLSVDYPSSDPYITAVGGTTLYASGGKRTSEGAWTGGGGGISDYHARPTWNNGNGVPAGDKRVSSDISLVSDPWTGYAIYVEGQWGEVGGTSAAAPMWAALWGLTLESTGGRLGLANETIYRAGNSAEYSNLFFDVVTGDNGDHRGPGYKTTPNWDHPTGWGTPNGTNLQAWIKADAAKNPPGTFSQPVKTKKDDEGVQTDTTQAPAPEAASSKK